MRQTYPVLAALSLFLVAMAIGCASGEIGPTKGGASDAGNNGSDAFVPTDGGGANNGGDGGMNAPDMGGPNNGTSDLGDDDSGMEEDVGTDDMGTDDMGMQGGGCKDQTTQGWVALGNPLSALPGASNVLGPDVAVDDQCRPIVAWSEGASTGERDIYVKRFNGTDWDQLGGTVDADGDSNTTTSGPVLASSGDRLFLAWSESTSNGSRIFAAEYSSGAWNELPDIPDSDLDVFTFDLAVDSTGRPYVAWSADMGAGTANKIYVARHDNGQWSSMGGGLEADTSGTTSALAPSLAFDATDAPIVAWQESNFIRLRRWGGTSWELFASGDLDALADFTPAFDINLATSPNDTLVAGWREASGSTDVYVRMWNGSAWEPLGDGIDAEDETSGRTNTGNLAIAADSSDRTVIAWDEPQGGFSGTTRVFIRRHDGTSFGALGVGVIDVNMNDTSGWYPNLAIDQNDRVVLVFQEEGDEARDVHVWRYAD